ncbi:MAG: 3-dehydroquinate synthase [Candidatus Peribacteraceae bacterium]|nr:3-dehydroquinate synthase [Candidatus Peribacteraceae bacterium]
MHTLTLTPPARSNPGTDITIGAGALQQCALHAKSHSRIVVLYDEGIESIATRVMHAIGDCVRIPVQSGDASKSLKEADRIVSVMLEQGCTRKTLLICVGGGMITDLGGFVASVFMRGIQCVHVPTTLLGMVDAAIGGKTAVNVGSKKNMIGTITHPRAVIIDTELLQTLPDSQLAEGLAEVIKVAAIIDDPFFQWLEEVMPQILKRHPAILEECVIRAVSAKVKIVEADEHDRDERLLLNFGHTVGHAVEALSGYKLSHGNCVSIGVVAEMTLTDFKDRARVEKILTLVGLPLAIPPAMKPEDLWTVMLSDKKNEGGVVRIAVPKRMGEGAVHTLTHETFLTLFR